MSSKLLMDLKRFIIPVDLVKLILIILMAIPMIIVKNVIITMTDLRLYYVLKLSMSFLWCNPLHWFFSTILTFVISFIFLPDLKNSKQILQRFTIFINLFTFILFFIHLTIYLLNSTSQHLKVRNIIFLMKWPPVRIHLEKKD